MTNDNIAARKIMEAADFIAATGATPDVRAWDHLVAYLPKDQTKYEYVQDVLRRLNDGGISLNCCAKLILAGIAQTPDISKRPFAFAVRRAPDNGPDQWRLFMDEGEARAEAEQLDGDYEALFRVGDRRSAIAALQAPADSDAVRGVLRDFITEMDRSSERPSFALYQRAKAALTAPAAKAPADAVRELLVKCDACNGQGETVHASYARGPWPDDYNVRCEICGGEGKVRIWPEGERFSFFDEPGEHDPCYVVMPGGAMLPFNYEANPHLDIARAKFIIEACNAALARAALERGIFEELPRTDNKVPWSWDDTLDLAKKSLGVDSEMAKEQVAEVRKIADAVTSALASVNRAAIRKDLNDWQDATVRGCRIASGELVQNATADTRRALQCIEQLLQIIDQLAAPQGNALVWDSNENRQFEPVERLAKSIYERMAYDGPGDKPTWVPNGNAFKQDVARAHARDELRGYGVMCCQCGEPIAIDETVGGECCKRCSWTAALTAPAAKAPAVSEADVGAAEIAGLVTAAAKVIADWSADCKVDDDSIVALLTAYNAMKPCGVLLLNEVESAIQSAAQGGGTKSKVGIPGADYDTNDPMGVERDWPSDPPSQEASAPVEQREVIAEALWRHEGSSLPAAKRARDAEKFLEQSESTQRKWLGFADAILSLPGSSRDEVLEEAAKVCDEHAQSAEDKIIDDTTPRSQVFANISNTANDCAAMIRALTSGGAKP